MYYIKGKPIQPPPILEDKGKILPAPARPPRPYDNKVTSLGAKEPRKAWEDDSHISDEYVKYIHINTRNFSLSYRV